MIWYTPIEMVAIKISVAAGFALIYLVFGSTLKDEKYDELV